MDPSHSRLHLPFGVGDRSSAARAIIPPLKEHRPPLERTGSAPSGCALPHIPNQLSAECSRKSCRFRSDAFDHCQALFTDRTLLRAARNSQGRKESEATTIVLPHMRNDKITIRYRLNYFEGEVLARYPRVSAASIGILIDDLFFRL